MSENIAVVKPYYLKGRAYKMGHQEFESVELEPGEDIEDFEFSPFTGTARWANVIAPKLRCMAGFGDGGHGTYTFNRQVAAINPGCEEDEPAEAELTEASIIHDELVDAYRMGAYDAVEGTFDPDSALV